MHLGGGGGGVKPPAHSNYILHAKTEEGVQIACKIASRWRSGEASTRVGCVLVVYRLNVTGFASIKILVDYRLSSYPSKYACSISLRSRTVSPCPNV